MAELKQRVMRELPDALTRLDSLYSRVSATGTLNEETQSTRVDPGVGVLMRTWSHKWTMQASGDLKKLERDSILAKRRDPSTGSLRDLPISPANPARMAACRGRSYSFQVRWEKHAPILASFGKPGDEDINKVLTHSIDDLLQAPCGVFAWGGLRMSRILTFPSFTITDIAKTPGRSGDNLLISFTFDGRDNPAYDDARRARAAALEKSGTRIIHVHKMWIEISPSQGWTIQASGRNRALGSLDLRREIEYGETRDGVPIPRRVRIHEPFTATTTVLEIANIDFGPVPESQFTLSAYGLPELGGPPQGRRENRLAFMLIIGAVVALFVALALKQYAKRLGRPVSSS